MGASNAMMRSSAFMPKQTGASKVKTPGTLMEQPKPNLIPPKPKISLVNNRNKHDHV